MASDTTDLQTEAGEKPAGKVRLLTLADMDSRTRAYQALKKRREAFALHLGGGETLSAMQMELVDSAAALGTIREHAMTRWLTGEDVDVDQIAGVCKSQRQILAALGLKKQLLDVTPNSMRDQLMRKRA